MQNQLAINVHISMKIAQLAQLKAYATHALARLIWIIPT